MHRLDINVDTLLFIYLERALALVQTFGEIRSSIMGRSVVLESDALAAKTADLPEPGHDEVLVRVLACGVSPINLQVTSL